MPDARITVGEELSLIGTHCPGSVNITCIGTYLTALRWTYNGNAEIETYFPGDSVQQTDLSNRFSSFTSVALLHVSHPYSLFSNFTSVLTANLVQLQQESIHTIKCGDPGTVDVVPVNFSIQEQVIPNKPQINGIVATYKSTQLDSIQITWTRSTVSYTHNNITMQQTI